MLIAIIILSTILGILLLFLLLGFLAAIFALSKGRIQFLRKRMMTKFPELFEKEDFEWINTKFQKVKLDNKHKRGQCGYLYKKDNAHVYIVYAHGYMGSIADKTEFLKILSNQYNFNVLVVEQRGHDSSKYLFSSMGLKESQDLSKWCHFIINLDPDAQIVIFGQSMGGMTVLKSLNENLPTNVKCVVADSGYASVYEQFVYSISTVVPKWLTKIFMLGAILIFLLMFQKNIVSNTAYKAFKTNKLPVCLIQGNEDTVVPFECLNKNYDAIKQLVYKEKHVFDKTDHVASFLNDPERYIKIFLDFVTQFIKH